jgi:hypothetical protein
LYGTWCPDNCPDIQKLLYDNKIIWTTGVQIIVQIIVLEIVQHHVLDIVRRHCPGSGVFHLGLLNANPTKNAKHINQLSRENINMNNTSIPGSRPSDSRHACVPTSTEAKNPKKYKEISECIAVVISGALISIL